MGSSLYNRSDKIKRGAGYRLYKRYSGKPSSIPEWGPCRWDGSTFVYRMGRFVKTHSRVELISHFDSKAEPIFDLRSQPHAFVA